MLGQLNLLRGKVPEVSGEAASQRGHISNLGHGILPETPVEKISAVVAWVHQETRSKDGCRRLFVVVSRQFRRAELSPDPDWIERDTRKNGASDALGGAMTRCHEPRPFT
jgi:hypothetical protein